MAIGIHMMNLEWACFKSWSSTTAQLLSQSWYLACGHFTLVGQQKLWFLRWRSKQFLFSVTTGSLWTHLRFENASYLGDSGISSAWTDSWPYEASPFEVNFSTDQHLASFYQTKKSAIRKTFCRSKIPRHPNTKTICAIYQSISMRKSCPLLI
jgi:hypothetical protein